MTILTTTKRIVTTTAAAAVLGLTGVAGAAEAPVVSKQRWIAGTAPVTIPGTGVAKGEWMGSKTRMVFRDVTLSKGQRPSVTLTALKGDRIRGLGLAENAKIGFTVRGKGTYSGRRSVSFEVFTRPGEQGPVTGRVYALSR